MSRSASVCLPVCLSVCSPSFLPCMPLALLSSTLNCAAVCISLCTYVCVYVVSPLPHLSREGGCRAEKRQHVGEQVYSKWHQKYLRFIMTTDISLFDICVGCPALKSARQLIHSPSPLCFLCSLCCCCCCLIRFN